MEVVTTKYTSWLCKQNSATYTELYVIVDKLPVFQFDQQGKNERGNLSQGSDTVDWQLKYPPEATLELYIQGERKFAICGNRWMVLCL